MLRHLYFATSLLLLVATTSVVAYGQQKTLKISQETTRLLGPLDKRGYVDYVAALNLHQAKGVTPESNYEVAIRRLIGPDDIPAMISEPYFKRLGIENPKEGPFLTDFVSFLVKQGGKTHQKIQDEFNSVLSGPWSATDHFEAEVWLQQEKERIDRLVNASKLSHSYTPYVSTVDPDSNESMPPLISILMPSVQKHRDFARTLLIRANQQIENGSIEAAWADMMAVQRLSRLSAKGATLIELLVGIAIENMAFDAFEHVLNSKDLTNAQAALMLKDVNELSYLPSLADKLDRAERFMCLDALQMLSQEEDLFKALNVINALSGNAPKVDPNPVKLVAFQKEEEDKKKTLRVNWNVSAKLVNKWYDRLVAICREPDFKKRHEQYDKFEEELEGLMVETRRVAGIMIGAFKEKPSDEYGRLLGQTLLGMFLPAVRPATDAHTASMQRLDVLRLALAAKVYHERNQRYPDKLSELESLVPKIELDRFSGEAIQLHSSEDGFVLYSIGRNRINDLGRDYKDAEERVDVEWDDIVIRGR